MRYAQDNEPIRWFRGYVFLKGTPVEIKDRCTADLLSKDNAFRRIEDEKVEETAEETRVLASDACVKCGKVVRQGRYMHERYCRGR